MMRALGGNRSSNSYPSVISNLFKLVTVSLETQIVAGSALPTKIGIRYLNSDVDRQDIENSVFSGRKRGGSVGSVGSDGDDKISSRGGADFPTPDSPPCPIPGRRLRGDSRRTPELPHQAEKGFRGNNFRGIPRRDEPAQFSSRQPMSRKPQGSGITGGGGTGARLDSSLFDKLDQNNGGRKDSGFGRDSGIPKNDTPRPSIKDLFNTPSKEDDDFLEKFKLSSGSKKDDNLNEPQGVPISEEEKLEPPQDADMIFKKMKESGLIPNAVNMLDGLCKDGLVQEAMKLFGLMREKGTMPEVVIYTAVVDGFCKAHKFDDAKRIFRKMQSNGIAPNAFSYGVIIKGLYKSRRLEEALDFCIEMLEAGHSPNVVTFTELVDGFCKEKGVEEGRKAVEALKQKGFYMEEKTIKEHLNKRGPRSPMVWEAVFGQKKGMQALF